jgi:hypothetical protein
MSIPLRVLLVAVAVAFVLGVVFLGLFLSGFELGNIEIGRAHREGDPVVRVALSNVPEGAIPTFVVEQHDVRVTRFAAARAGDSYVVPLPGPGEWTVKALVAVSDGKTRSASGRASGGQSLTLRLTDDFPLPWVLFFALLAALGVAVLAGGVLLARSLRRRTDHPRREVPVT